MLKKLISIPFIITLLLVGCSKTPETDKDSTKPKNQQTANQQQTDKSLNIVTSPQKKTKESVLLLNSEDISYTEFLQTDSALFFVGNNNQLSVTEDNISPPYILEDQVTETFDYSVESIVAIGSEIFFTNLSDNNSLYKLNYDKKETSKVLSGNFNNITPYKNDIVFINRNNGSTLNYLDTKSLKVNLVSSDKCGKFIINGDYIIYQNLSDNSSVYSIKIDGSEKTKLIATPTNTFITYEGNILSLSGDANNLYIYDPKAKTNKNLGSINGSNLKTYNDKLYYINLSDSNHLYELTIDSTLEKPTSTKLVNDMVNDYFPTKNGIFIRKPINTNRVFFIESE